MKFILDQIIKIFFNNLFIPAKSLNSKQEAITFSSFIFIIVSTLLQDRRESTFTHHHNVKVVLSLKT